MKPKKEFFLILSDLRMKAQDEIQISMCEMNTNSTSKIFHKRHMRDENRKIFGKTLYFNY